MPREHDDVPPSTAPAWAGALAWALLYLFALAVAIVKDYPLWTKALMGLALTLACVEAGRRARNSYR